MSQTNGVAALNQRSRQLVGGTERAGARAMLKAVGYDDEALAKPLIGVANTWTEIGPCNFHLRKLAHDVKRGIRAAGGTPFEFNTVSISDGITMGTEGMKGSLISREVIADSIELVAMSNMLDGVVALSACDKTIPGTIMALIRLNLPSLMLYGGTIYPGMLNGERLDVVSVYEALGKFQSGQISYDELMEVENLACPGPGRLRRTVHRQYDGDDQRGYRHLSDGHGRRPSRRPGKKQRCLPRRTADARYFGR